MRSYSKQMGGSKRSAPKLSLPSTSKTVSKEAAKPQPPTPTLAQLITGNISQKAPALTATGKTPMKVSNAKPAVKVSPTAKGVSARTLTSKK